MSQPADEVLAVHEALEKLAATDIRAAELIKLRYFAGFTMKEAAKVQGVNYATFRNLEALWRSPLDTWLKGRGTTK